MVLLVSRATPGHVQGYPHVHQGWSRDVIDRQAGSDYDVYSTDGIGKES
jgi:hypothetical protein